MNKWLSITALLSTTIFAIIMILAYAGTNFTLFITSVIDIFVLPFFFLIIISLVYAVFKWIKNKDKSSLKYMIYSFISFIITGGIIIYTIWQYGVSMSNFD